MKPCSLLNLAPDKSRLKSLLKSSLEWATIELLQTWEFVLFFTMHHKAKLSQWITKEKSFPSWCVQADADAHQCQCIRSSELTCPLCQFRVCIVCLVLYYTSKHCETPAGVDKTGSPGSCAFPLTSTSQTFITLREIFYDRFGSTVVIHFCLEK